MRSRIYPTLLLALASIVLTACGEGADTNSTGSVSSAAASSGASSGDPGPVVDRGPTSIAIDGDPNGLWWDAATPALYIADDNGNRILQWTDAAGISLAGTLPDAPPDSAGLGQVVKTADGTLIVPRFGGGFAGDVVFIDPDGNTGTVPNLDVIRRRIGLTVAADGTLYIAYFVSINGQKNGAVARLDLSGTEVDILTGLQKPIGVLAVGEDLITSDQQAGTIIKASIAPPNQLLVIAQLDGPDLLCEGPNGSIFTGGKTGSVRQVFGDGKFSELAGGFQEVRGVAFDAENKRLFVADHDADEADGVTHLLRIIPVD